MNRTPIRRVSKKQSARESRLARIKKSKIAEQVEEYGFAFCVKCGASFPREEAIYKLDLDHIVMRSHESPEVADRPENLRLLCRKIDGCHGSKHNQ